MKVNKKDLLEKLNYAKQTATGWKGILDISNTFMFTGKYIVAYNDRTAIFIKFESEFTAIVPANELYKIIGNIKKEQITIHKEDNQLIIKAGKIKVGINIIDSEIKEVDCIIQKFPKKYNKLPDNFFDGLLLNTLSTSKDATKTELTCIHVCEDIMESSDNYRISSFTMTDIIKDELMISGISAQELLSIKQKFISYKKIDGWVLFCTEDKNLIYALRDIEATFPDTSKFFDIKSKTKKIVLPTQFMEDLNIVSIFAHGEFDLEKQVKIQIKDGFIICSTTHDKGFATTKIKIDSKQNACFNINPIFLKEILSKSNKFILTDSFILFTTKNFKHIISLYIQPEEE